MSLAARVYAEELYRHGFGHPLWSPEPTKGLDGCVREIHLGDVGYIDEDGGFRRLFNVTVDATHELNAGGVPQGFVPVKLNENLIIVRDRPFDPLPLCSESVEGHVVEGHGSVDINSMAGAEISYNFKCTSHRGAFLILKGRATKAMIGRNARLERYMLQHHESWFAFATDEETLGIQCEPESIVLVQGVLKTSGWTVGAFPGKIDRSQEFRIGAKVETLFNAHAQVSTTRSESHGCIQRSGPDRASGTAEKLLTGPTRHATSSPMAEFTDRLRGSNYPQDQCVFLKYYKIKHRRLGLLPKKIVANADPPDLDGDFNHGADSAVFASDDSIEPETAFPSVQSPLDHILDYILDHSAAKVAIASDADVEWLQPEGKLSSSLVNTLQNRAPGIHLDGSGAGKLDYEDVQQDTQTSLPRNSGPKTNSHTDTSAARNLTSRSYFTKLNPDPDTVIAVMGAKDKTTANRMLPQYGHMVTSGSRALNIEHDTVVAVMGPSGSGKSNFINLISGDHLLVNDSLRSCTNKVQATQPFTIPGYSNSVTLIDTPGFDDTVLSDADVLKMIAMWLSTSYEQGVKLSGIIYMHRITDRRVGGISRKNFRMLRDLCGEDTLKNVAIVTTMWDQEPLKGEYAAREQELMTDELFFKCVIDKGAQMLRHDNSINSARNIVSSFIAKPQVTLRIQTELVDEKKDITETAAGKDVQGELASLIEKYKRELQGLKEELMEAIEKRDLEAKQELEEERAEMHSQLQKIEADEERLSREYREEKARADAEIRRLKTEFEAEREGCLTKEKDIGDVRVGAKERSWRRRFASRLGHIFR